MASTKTPAAKKSVAPAKAAPVAAKKAVVKAAPPAPAPAPEEVAAATVGTTIKFLGYAPETEEDQRVLVDGELYEVAGITDPDEESGDEGGDVFVYVDNPDFDPKKKESDSNAKLMAVVVLPDEYEVVEAGEEGEEEAAAEEEAPAPAPAPAAAKKTAAKKTAPAAAEPAAKTTGKKAAPAKKEAPAAAEAPEPERLEGEELPELEIEDESVQALVAEAGDGGLIQVAMDLERQQQVTEFQLGGVLYHLKKSRQFTQVEGGEAYAEKGGWAQFLQDYMLIEYRKAQYLIDIYVKFSQAGIADASERVAAIGWAKAARIAPLMTVEGNEPEELLKLAETNTLKDLVTTIKEQVTVGGTVTGGTRVTRTSLKFRLIDAEAGLTQMVLKQCAEANNLKNESEALVFIMQDYATTHGIKAVTKAAPTQNKAVTKAAPDAPAAPAKKAAPARKPVAA